MARPFRLESARQPAAPPGAFGSWFARGIRPNGQICSPLPWERPAGIALAEATIL